MAKQRLYREVPHWRGVRSRDKRSPLKGKPAPRDAAGIAIKLLFNFHAWLAQYEFTS